MQIIKQLPSDAYLMNLIIQKKMVDSTVRLKLEQLKQFLFNLVKKIRNNC